MLVAACRCQLLMLSSFLSVRMSVPVGFDGAWLIVTYGTYCHIEYVEASLGCDVAFASEALFVCLNLQLQDFQVMLSLMYFPTYMRSHDCRIVSWSCYSSRLPSLPSKHAQERIEGISLFWMALSSSIRNMSRLRRLVDTQFPETGYPRFQIFQGAMYCPIA